LHTNKQNNILKLTNYTKTKCIQPKKKDKQKQNKQTKYKAKKKKLETSRGKKTSIVG
jgi:hypothetical protein